MVLIATALPSTIRATLHASFLACITDVVQLQETDSREYGWGNPRFVAIHCSWYNRHATKVWILL